MKNLSKNGNAKNCTKCKQTKKLSKFRKRSDYKYLYHSWCRECELAGKKAYAKTVKGKRALKKYNASASRKNIKYKFNHSKKNKKSQTKYRTTAGYALSQRMYKSSPKGLISQKVSGHRRRSRMKNIKYKVTRAKLKKLIKNNIVKYFKLTCEYCKRKVTLKNYWLDHRKPISKGGTNHFNNLAVSCKKCNLSKNNKTVKQFMLTRAEVLK